MNWLLILVRCLGKQRGVFFSLQLTDVNVKLLSWTAELCQSNCFDEIDTNEPS